jgi:hypothetical protein
VSDNSGTQVLGAAIGPLNYFWMLPTSIFALYASLLLLTSLWVYRQEKDIRVALLTIPGIFVTHIWYGLRFIQGFFSKGLKR